MSAICNSQRTSGSEKKVFRTDEFTLCSFFTTQAEGRQERKKHTGEKLERFILLCMQKEGRKEGWKTKRITQERKKDNYTKKKMSYTRKKEYRKDPH